MRVLPRSLTGRLLVTTCVTLLVGFGLSSIIIGHELGWLVLHDMDERLDAQIEILASSVDANGTLDPGFHVDAPPFNRPGSGWAWEVIGDAGTVRSASLNGADLPMPPPPPPPPEQHLPRMPHFRRDGVMVRGELVFPRPMDVRGRDGRLLHYRVASVPTSFGRSVIIVAGPREIVERPLRRAMTPLLVCLGGMAFCLLVALFAQLRVGLGPLVRLQAMVAEVRAGKLRQIHVSEPTELLPLVDELNELIQANEQAVARARTHVANLAHGLKTPLAALKLDLAESACDADGRLAALVERMESQIRRHLGRARATSAGTAAHPVEIVAPHIEDLVSALRRLHAERRLDIEQSVPDDLLVRCDGQDLDEMLGNLLDNAWRHARSKVRISAPRGGRLAQVLIEDDGAGLGEAEMLQAMQEGRRLDETEAGYGFGLSISRELCELHGGSLELRRSGLGGLAAVITLPRGGGTE
ncbi:signal transduction histidine kinase [Acetobacter nitrogenifigens DSM 23921 = NBRC 105050]|uniref:histidine kinase n=1 Tax=Acetobacter nitrogenifigens DSM 23921 = NBRC 105050 TaxID=1120919 RepID=A0A511XDV8_9PROT|nr:HAMP domain-containing sensor histidine kinase [Acetobacter nitrogenifigens]GBQ92635.1 signal transduction histidine kinase [Acetobacter nitrogenifigens DSM 23921 = NBRC 105050]GEN61136.1 histidine kinase [Acetobacter nitrogenifigens DSM 23921 = NBRC 105050]